MCFIYISIVTTNTNGYELKCWYIKTTFEFILFYEITTKASSCIVSYIASNVFSKNFFLLHPINLFIFEQIDNFIIQIIAKIIYFLK